MACMNCLLSLPYLSKVQIKDSCGLPEALASYYTTIVDRYVIEGHIPHIPAEDV